VSAIGARAVSLGEFAPGQNQIEIDFVALGLAAGEVLRYQYRLEGAAGEWSAPSLLRTVNFGSLAHGQYRFLVRAINANGAMSAEPASVTFTILRPIWLRWWFLTLGGALLAAAVLSIHRYRVARVLELAAIRTRIATDLHDDIGANLTRISLLSEVTAPGADQESMASIGNIARESAGSMSDIVWAIDPKHESLADLIRRMRRHGEEVFALRDIELTFQAPVAPDGLRLGMDVRRDLLLIFKEAVSNAARHAHCSRVSIDLSIKDSRVVLIVADNGVGFDTAQASDGQGLASLRRRAQRLNATIDVQSRPRAGTTIVLHVPLSRHHANS
jgi:signal transduction histidine kinase